jgi:hypothetical protein
VSYVLPAVNAATALAPVLLGAFHRPKKGPNINDIINRYRASRPAGYVTPQDELAAERTRTRIAGAATAAAGRQRQMTQRAITARGLGGPAAEALNQEATDTEAAGAEEAARTSADQLYRAFQSNLGYARGQNDTAFGAELSSAQQQAFRNQAQEATFWNSMNEAIPAVAGALPSFGRAGGGDSMSPTATGAGSATGTTGVVPGPSQHQSPPPPVGGDMGYR